jgi:hypothetical protein
LLPNGKVLVAGGSISWSNRTTSAELYDPVADTWTTTGSLNTPRDEHTATLLPNGKVLVAGGFNTFYLTGAELYDPATGLWSVTGGLDQMREYHTATLLPNGLVLVVGGLGSGGGEVWSSELYDPAAGTWHNAGWMNAGMYHHTATLLPNGKVLVAGGEFNHINLQYTHLYDPTTDSWSSNPTGWMSAGKSSHTATLLLNGKVLVAGGYGGPEALYDPALGTWSVTAAMSTARAYHTATLLTDGTVLVAGGDCTVSCTELYDVGLGYSTDWQPSLDALSLPITNRLPTSLTGSGFRGYGSTEASDGSTQSSASNIPAVQLISLGNEQTLWLTEKSFTGTTITLPPVAAGSFPPGYARLTVFVNGIPSQSQVVRVIGYKLGFLPLLRKN